MTARLFFFLVLALLLGFGLGWAVGGGLDEPSGRRPTAPTKPPTSERAVGSSRAQARAVARSYLLAEGRADRRRVCALMSTRMSRQMLRSPTTGPDAVEPGCAERAIDAATNYGTLVRVRLRRIRLGDSSARVDAELFTGSTAETPMRTRLRLVRERGRWRVDDERAGSS